MEEPLNLKMGRPWYNMLNPLVRSYTDAYEKIKRDIIIEEEKAVNLICEQIDGIRCKEKRAKKRGGLAGPAWRSSIIRKAGN